MANIIKGLLPSGKAPSVLKDEIISLVKAEAPAPDLSGYATVEAVESVVKASGGIRQVSGNVVLSPADPPVVEMYAAGNVSVNGAVFAAGAAVVARRTPAGIWQVVQVPESVWEGGASSAMPVTPAPVAGGYALKTSGVGPAGFTMTVTGSASDISGAEFRFAPDGAVFSAWQSQPTYAAVGLAPGQIYRPAAEVRKAGAVQKIYASDVLTGAARSFIETLQGSSPSHLLAFNDAPGSSVLRALAGADWVLEPGVAGVTLGAPGIGAGKASMQVQKLVRSVATAPRKLLEGLSDWSVEMLVKTDGIARQAFLGVSRETWGIAANDGALYYYEGGQFYFAGSTPAGVHHIVITRSGQELKTYVGGKSTGTHALTSVPAEPSNPVIGSFSGFATAAGAYGALAIYRRPLSAAEVAEHYSAIGA